MNDANIGMTLYRSSSATLVAMDLPQHVGGPRLLTQISIKDRSAPPNRVARPELCVHSIPVIIILCFLFLWIVSTEVESPITISAVKHLPSPTGESVTLAVDPEIIRTVIQVPPSDFGLKEDIDKQMAHTRGKKKLQHIHVL